MTAEQTPLDRKIGLRLAVAAKVAAWYESKAQALHDLQVSKVGIDGLTSIMELNFAWEIIDSLVDQLAEALDHVPAGRLVCTNDLTHGDGK